MSLQPGARLGPYEIESPLGAGGMGEVYRARDTRLDRTVAIKVLPTSLAGDPQFRERFDREARTLSGLDHPHICALFDVGQHEGSAYLVMPLLDGETLASRLERGAIPLPDALTLAAQIADALDRAHRAGIVHRDLKPGNVMLTKTGVRLLDFGLAKASAPVVAGAGASMATREGNLTTQGSILGTLQYMAPEQLAGREADARTDIFAFGTLAYEMVTGRKAFDGQSHASLIAAILEREPPPVSSGRPVTFRSLDRLIAKCLAKDPDARWQSAADLADELRWVASPAAGGTTAAAPGHAARAWLPWLVAGLAVAGAAGALVAARSGYLAPVAERSAVISTYPLPQGLRFTGLTQGLGRFAISPDGRRLVFQGEDGTGRARLWVRSLDSVEAHPIPGTDRGQGVFWSPDSRFIAFEAGGQLKRVDLTGGVPIVLAEKSGGMRGAWGDSGTILYPVTRNGPIYRVPAEGGTAEPATTLDAAAGETGHYAPTLLPGGRQFLFTAVSNVTQVRGVFAGTIGDFSRRLLMPGISNADYADGRLLFMRDTSLMCQPFDPARLELSGEPALIAGNVDVGTARTGAFSVSPAGVLVYQPSAGGDLSTELRLVDRAGAMLSRVADSADQIAPVVSPDGTRALVSVMDAQRGTRDLWIYHLGRPSRVRLTLDAAEDMHGVWSADGTQIIYASMQKSVFDLYRRNASGAGVPELIVAGGGHNKYPTSWSRDGQTLLYFNGTGGSPTGSDLWRLPLATRKPEALVQTEFYEAAPAFSPDMRWIAYQSNESGPNEVYIMPADGSALRTAVSIGGGVNARWRGDGRELFYLAQDSRMMAVTVETRGRTLQVGPPRMLFEFHARTGGYSGLYAGAPYDVLPDADGQRFLINVLPGSRTPPSFTIAVNWTSLPKRR